MARRLTRFRHTREVGCPSVSVIREVRDGWAPASAGETSYSRSVPRPRSAFTSIPEDLITFSLVTRDSLASSLTHPLQVGSTLSGASSHTHVLPFWVISLLHSQITFTRDELTPVSRRAQ